MRLRTSLLAVLCCFWSTSTLASTATDWLKANQNAAGSWGSEWFSAFRPTTELRDTAAAVRALRQSGETASTEYANGVSWLAAEDPNTVDYLARKIIVLSDTAATVTMEFSALLDAHNVLLGAGLPNEPGGGWGTAEGHESNAPDTALALQAIDAQGLEYGWQLLDLTVPPGAGNAYGFQVPSDATNIRVEFFSLTEPVRVRLKQGSVPLLSDPYVDVFSPSVVVYPDAMPFTPGVNYVRFNVGAASTMDVVISWENPTIDTRVIARGLDFLRACQQAGGGFGIQPGGDSKLSVTVAVLRAMGAFGVGYDTDAAEASGGAYVASLQNGSGAVGHVPGSPTASETALAKIAFGAIGMSTEETLAHLALVAMQDASGHWDGDEYTTAVAVQALTLVPEPGTVLGLACGTAFLAVLKRRRRGQERRSRRRA